MKMDDKKNKEEITRLEKQISGYPVGSISKKIINGKVRYYHQWYELGKTKSKYLTEDDAAKLRAEIELRKQAQKRLSTLKKQPAPKTGKKESILNKKLAASITFPIEITGWFNGKFIIPDMEIQPEAGQQVLVTIRNTDKTATTIDLDKYLNHGEKLFATDAQEYVRDLRNEERI